MKRMWSEEEVTAAIAEYAAAHPAGGKLFLHNVSFYDDSTTYTWKMKLLSTEKNPFTTFGDMIGKCISVSGSHETEDGYIVLAVANDDMDLPSFWYIDQSNGVQRVSEPVVSNFTDIVTPL